MALNSLGLVWLIQILDILRTQRDVYRAWNKYLISPER